ncbi:MAG TPA: DUF4349 domain-containing protein [Bryobacteraceae bacterium]
MTRIVYAAPAVLLLSLCLGCNSGKSKLLVDLERPNAPEKKAMAADSAGVSATYLGNGLVGDEEFKQTQHVTGGQKPAVQKVAAPVPNPDWDKKIIKTAELDLEVKSFGTFTRRLHQSVKAMGGYIAQEEESRSEAEISNNVTIKVPVAAFDDLVSQIPADSDRLVDKKITSQDVTMEMVDTKSRLESKKEVRERYLELLRQAHSMKDILAVQNEINDIQQDMEAAAGRIAYLGHSAAYSTINLKFYQVLVREAPDDRSPSFVHRLKDAIADGWDGFSNFLIGLLHVWPFLIGAGFVFYWVRKTMRSAKVQPVPVRPQEESAK